MRELGLDAESIAARHPAGVFRFMIIALFPNEQKKHSFELAIHIREFLEEQGITVVAEDEKAASDRRASPLFQSIPKRSDSSFRWAAMGRFCASAIDFRHLDAPILGINLGHLGFMADIPVADIYPSLTDLLNGAYTIDKRLALEASNSRREKLCAPSTTSSSIALKTTASSNSPSK